MFVGLIILGIFLPQSKQGVAMSDDFGYETIVDWVASRGMEECGSSPEEDFFLVEVMLNQSEVLFFF